MSEEKEKGLVVKEMDALGVETDKDMEERIREALRHSFASQHIYSVAAYLKARFQCRVAKLSLRMGFSCPNRDGKKGYGGCAFCSEKGGAYYASDFEEQKALIKDKWPDAKYLAYLQSNTNTYKPAEELRRLYDEVLKEDVLGLVLGTRADCLPPDVVDLLVEYHKKTFLWVELGLQTVNERLRDELNICMTMAEFEEGALSLINRGIKVVFHIIIGLPGETYEDYVRTVKYAVSLRPFGIKLHMFHLLEGTALGAKYGSSLSLMTREEYVKTICDLVELIPEGIVLHRLTGDPPKDGLIGPLWARDKRGVLNAIQKEFRRRGTYQGYRTKFDISSAIDEMRREGTVEVYDAETRTRKLVSITDLEPGK